MSIINFSARYITLSIWNNSYYTAHIVLPNSFLYTILVYKRKQCITQKGGICMSVDKLRTILQTHKVSGNLLLIGLAAFFSCCLFPVYNVTMQNSLRIPMLAVILFAYYEIGVFFAAMYPNKAIWQVALFFLLASLLGMGCRYLLEFGEISNVYNFTLPNIGLHLLVTTTIVLFCWHTHKRHAEACD